MAVLPSAESPTAVPCDASVPWAPAPTSLLPCWDQVPPVRENTQAAPAKLLSKVPPSMRVLPSAESASPLPCSDNNDPTTPVPNSLACWLQAPPVRVKIQTAPAPSPSLTPPTAAVLPSPESATQKPWLALKEPAPPVPTSLGPCWLQTPPVRVNTHAAPYAPVAPLSLGPPRIAVFPSPESATDQPCPASAEAPAPTSLVPCWLHTPPVRVNTHAAPAPKSLPTLLS